MYKLNYLGLFLFIIYCSPFVSCQRRRTLYENDRCNANDNRWVCKKLSQCPTAQQGIRAGTRPQTCSFEGLEPIVCCSPAPNIDPVPDETPTSSSNVNSKAKQMCIKYAKYVFREELPPILLASTVEEQKTVKYDECARSSQTLIVGGVDAMPKEFPHMVQIGYGEQPRISWLCGGSLISENYVLSAAHCSKPGNRGPAKWARIGDLNVDTEDDDARPIITRIVERIDHPNYDLIRLYNDITLFKLDRKIKLSHYIRPICLDTGDRKIEKAVATGWGHIEWGGHGSSSLKKVSLNLVSTRRCNSSYESSIGRQLPNGIIENYMVCAGDQEGKDTCQGDSGGPLQIPINEPYCMYSQIGVTSFGRECGTNVPGVYTRVSHYLPWIEKIVWP